MLRKILLTFVSISMLLVVDIDGREYLKDKPDFLKPCPAEETTFSNCFKDNIQSILLNWKDGVPGLPSAGKLDPLKLKRMKIEQNQLLLEMKNVYVEGLSQSKIKNLSIDLKDDSFIANITMPNIHIDSDYKTEGRILFLPLNGKGKMSMDIVNINLLIDFKSHIVQDEDNSFIDVKSVHSQIKTIGDFRIDMGNLFNGNKELEASTSAVFNENWREFLNPLLPTIEKIIDAVVLKRFKKVFSFVPAAYLILEKTVEI